MSALFVNKCSTSRCSPFPGVPTTTVHNHFQNDVGKQAKGGKKADQNTNVCSEVVLCNRYGMYKEVERKTDMHMWFFC